MGSQREKKVRHVPAIASSISVHESSLLHPPRRLRRAADLPTVTLTDIADSPWPSMDEKCPSQDLTLEKGAWKQCRMKDTRRIPNPVVPHDSCSAEALAVARYQAGELEGGARSSSLAAGKAERR